MINFVKKKKVTPHVIFLVIYMFMFLYFPPFISLSTHYFLAVIAYIYMAFHINSFVRFLTQKKVIRIMIVSAAIMVYLTLIAVIYHVSIKSVILGPAFWIAIYTPICFYLLHSIYQMGWSVKELILMLAACCNLQGVFALISFLYKPFHLWMLDRYIAYGYDAERYTGLANYRLYGLAFHLTNFAPLVAACLTPVIMKYAVKNIKYLLLTPLMIISVVLNSRTALVIMLLGIAVMLFYPNTNQVIKTKHVMQGIAVGFVLLIMAIIVINVIISMQKTANSWFAGWLISGFDSIASLFNGEKKGYFEYTSQSATWIIPKGIELLFGTGEDSKGSHANYRGTDVGYINYLWIGGVIYLVLLLALVWILIQPLHIKKENKWLFWFMAIAIVCLNIKDAVFVQNEFMCFLFILCMGCEYLNYSKAEKLIRALVNADDFIQNGVIIDES